MKNEVRGEELWDSGKEGAHRNMPHIDDPTSPKPADGSRIPMIGSEDDTDDLSEDEVDSQIDELKDLADLD